MVGWVKIHRALANHDLWLAEPFTYGQAWVDLLINTNHASGSFMVKRQRISIERGQLGWSEITMAERWKWSRGKVRRFLKRLSSDGMIEQQAGHLTSVITICNYDDYQDKNKEGGTSNGTPGGTALGTPDEHLTVHEAVHKQECKEELELKNEKKNTLPAAAAKPLIDFSVFGLSDDDLAEVKRIRVKNKGGAITTQRVANGLAKEINLALSNGLRLDDILTEWETRGWKSIKAEWLTNSIGGNNAAHQKSPQQRGQIDHDDLSWLDSSNQGAARSERCANQQSLQRINGDIPGMETGVLIDHDSRGSEKPMDEGSDGSWTF